MNAAEAGRQLGRVETLSTRLRRRSGLAFVALGLASVLAAPAALAWIPPRFWGSAGSWLPLGPEKGMTLNFLFVAGLIGGLLYSFFLIQKHYATMLSWCLSHKKKFLMIPLVIVVLGGLLVFLLRRRPVSSGPTA